MAQAKKKRNAEKRRTHREVWGVVLIALGVFLGFCLYAEATGIIGATVTGLLFGLSGIFAYAMPVVLCAGGVMFIVSAADAPQGGRTALVLLGAVLMVALLHVYTRPVLGNTPLIGYVEDAYLLGGAQRQGGGAIGALVSFPLLVLTGEVGAYIFLIAGLLIIVLLVTRLSLRDAGQRVGTQMRAGIEQAGNAINARRQNLYVEDLDEKIEAPKPRRRKAVVWGRSRVEAAPQRQRAQSRPKEKIARYDDDDLSFLPLEGPLAKKTQEEAAAVTAGHKEPPIVYYEDGERVQPVERPNTLRTMKRTAEQPSGPPERVGVESPHPKEWRDEEEPAAEQPHAHKPYVRPSVELLNLPRVSRGRSTETPAETGRLLIETLESFNVSARIVNISVGPVITRYELAPAPGVRVNRITALSDDIALALAAPRVRIEAPIPGKAAVGIEVPNKDTVTVVLRDIVDSREFQTAKSPITMALGKDIAGKVIVADLAKMPHLLIAGATGSGKSVCINDIIISLVYKCSPEELQLILVDPKVVELSSFGCLPHLKVPVVTDPKKAANALASGVREMDQRYKTFAQIGARDLERYNELQSENKLPKLVIIIDELADLMMVSPDTVEDSICRIAQLGRAAGIHLIVATQRPSADVITGLIKANVPSRIAFAVSSAIDSRIILDTGGAEKLLGRGDMLFHPNGSGKPMRAQGAFVGDDEVERVMRHFKELALAPEFDESLIEAMEEEQAASGAQGNGKQEDELLGEAVRIVLDSGQASISMIQRRLRVGYARAARLVDIMEQRGFVSGFDGSKPRRLLITRSQYEQIFGGGSGGGPDDER